MDSTSGSLTQNEDAFVETRGYGNDRNSDDVETHAMEKRVADKWMGTDSDRRDMMMLGRVQVLRVSSSDPFRIEDSERNL